MANQPRPTWQKRTLRWSCYIFILLALLAVTSWLALPALIKKIAVEQTQEKIGRKLHIGDISFNPFILALRARDIILYEPDQTTSSLSIKELTLNASSTSLLRLAPIVDEIRLTEPSVHVVRLGAEGIGRYNFSDIIDRIEAMPKSDGRTLFSLANLQLQNGALRLDDNVTGKTIDIRSLNVGVPFISNMPHSVDTFVQPTLSMTVNGTPFSLKGRSKPFASSLDTTLALDIDQLDVISYLPFVPVALPVRLESATLSTHLDITFSRDDKKPQVALDGNVTLTNVTLLEKNAAPLLKAGSISAQINKLNLLTLDGTIDQLSIDKPQLWAEMNAKGELNWSRLTTTATAPKPVAPPRKDSASATGNTKAQTDKPVATTTLLPQITLHKLIVREGSVKWSDDANATPRQLLQFTSLTLDAQDVSTRTDATPAKVNLSFVENGQGSVQFTGTLAPLKGNVSGKAVLKAVQLSNYQHYINRALSANLSGKVSAQAELQIAAGQPQLNQLGIEIDDLKLMPGSRSATGAVSAKSIILDNAALNLQSRKVEAQSLRIVGLNGDVRRDAKGELNLKRLIAKNDKPGAGKSAPVSGNTVGKTTNAPSEAGWQARLHTLSIAESSIAYEDQGVSPAQKLRVDSVNLKIDSLSTQLDQANTVSLQAVLNKSGKLSVSGQVSPQLKSVTLSLDARDMPLAPFQSFFTEYLNVTLTRGTLNTKGKLTMTPPVNKQTLSLRYNGAASLNNFRALDKITSSDFLRWRTLDLQGIDTKIGGTPLVSLKKITLSDFYARAILSDQGKLNLQDIFVSKGQPASSLTSAQTGDAASSSTVAGTTTSPTPVTSPSSSPGAPIIRIGQTVLQRGNINFTDNFVKPNYTANMTGMSGNIGSIASDNVQPATIDLRGKIDNDAPLQISGALNPLAKPMFLDIKASANGVQLSRLTPYSAKYAGYPITKGKLSMDVEYKIENEKLVAQNDVRIEQLTFGDHVDGPDVTKLPVMLAVSLLKDRNGNINLNLPVSGSLSDPQFSIGGIILRVFINLIVKAVTSPFALISSMFGSGSDVELSYVEFAPGSSEITPEIRKKLDTLGYALHQRPALKIDITGRVDPTVDDAGLRVELLNRKMRALQRRDLAENGGRPTSENPLSDAETVKYLEKVYKDETFKKPRNMIGLTKSLPPEDMKKLIIENTHISPDDLRSLAQRRADLVRNYLQDQSEISADRIFLIAPKLTADGIEDKGPTSRVDLSLQQ